MPKKNSDEKGAATKKKKDKKKGGCLIPIIIFFIISIALALVIFFDLFGVRTNFLSNALNDVPLVGNLIDTTEEGMEETVPEISVAELQAEIDQLTQRLENAEGLLAEEQEKSSLYAREIDRLREFEEAQEQFRSDKEQFDRMIAENDPNAFVQFYESMSPENQEVLYEEAILSQQRRTELMNYVRTIESMEARPAARMLEQLITSDMELVVLVLRNTNVDTRGEILGAMSQENAASVYRQMAPEQ